MIGSGDDAEVRSEGGAEEGDVGGVLVAPVHARELASGRHQHFARRLDQARSDVIAFAAQAATDSESLETQIAPFPASEGIQSRKTTGVLPNIDGAMRGARPAHSTMQPFGRQNLSSPRMSETDGSLVKRFAEASAKHTVCTIQPASCA